MLDHLTEGRLDFGLVRGILPEMSAVGISADEANSRFDEALELIDQAIQAKGPFSFHGKEWNFEDVRIIPRFLQKPSPPRWTAVVHPASAERAARHGWKIWLGFSSTEDMRQIAECYRRSGKNTSPDDIAIRRRVVFVENEGEVAAARAMAREDQNKTVEASRSLAPRTPDAPPPNPRVPPPDDEFIAGTPEIVANEIIRQCRLVGAGNFVVNLYANPDQQGISKSHDFFGREVIPALRSEGLR